MDAQQKCEGVPAASIQPVVSPSMVDSVKPAYTYALGGPNGRIARLAGAEVHLRPMGGASREWVARALECHEARVALGAACLGSDPYHAAPGWVDIEVESGGDGYIVRLTSDDVSDAHTIFDRARAFAARD